MTETTFAGALTTSPAQPVASGGQARRWFAVVLLNWVEGAPFWERDAGVFCEAFRLNGVDSRLVTLGPSSVREDLPLITAPLQQLQQADWWRQWGLEGVVLYSWALPRYTGVAAALKAAGVKTVLILDADGGRSPRHSFFHHVGLNYIYHRMQGRWYAWAIALPLTIARLPNWRYRAMLEHLEQVEWIALQSPLARQRFNRFLLLCGRPDLVSRVTVMPHPVSQGMIYDPQTRKAPLILAVGNWERLVKGAPLLVQALGLALQRAPEYRARIIGPGRQVITKLAARLPLPIQQRIETTGPLPNSQVIGHQQSARIFINTSYSESFCIAAAEALCCGCSVVGSARIASFNYFVSQASGTLAYRRSAPFFCDALCAEIEAWSNGDRDPAQISRVWSERVHADKVARAVLRLGVGRERA